MNDSMKIQLDLYGQLNINPKGKSMLPFLKENRNAVIVSIPKRPIKKYDIVLYKQNDVYILHRVIKTGKRAYVICGDNSNVLEKVKEQNIIGVVTEIISFNKKYSVDNLFLKFCVKLWYELGFKKATLLLKKCLKRYKRVGHNEANNKLKNKKIQKTS